MSKGMKKELSKKEMPQKEGLQKEMPQKEGSRKEGSREEMPQKEGSRKEGSQKEELRNGRPQKEEPQNEGQQKERLRNGMLGKIGFRKGASQKEEVSFRHYPVWDNYRVAFMGFAREMGGRGVAVVGAAAVLSVVTPFAALALPSAVVYLLESGWQPGIIFLALAGYVVLLQAMQVIKQHMCNIERSTRFLYRISQGPTLFGAAMEMDFEKYESGEGKQKLEGARGNIYYGNEVGIEAFLGDFKDAAVALAGLIIYSVIIGRLRIWMLALLFATAGIIMAVDVCADRRTIKYAEKYIKVNQGYTYLKNEVLVPANGKDIRLYRMWKLFKDEFEKKKEELAYWSGRQRSCSANANMFGQFIAFGRDVLVYGYLIAQMEQGELDLAAFLLYIGIVASFSGWMNSLTAAVPDMLKNNRYMSRYRDYLEFAGEHSSGDRAVEKPGKPHEIRLEHVSFRYEGNEEDTIHDLSLTVTPGEKIALVGMNGAGKSTLIKLICGLYRPSSGRIYLDGQDVSTIMPEEYRKEFAVVFQDVFAFSFPLADNVSCRPEAETDSGRLERSLRDAGLWERVMELPEKGKTSLNKDLDAAGVTLSGGEMQKLMLARALYKNAAVVILDEPTAALDPIAESGMYEKYYEMTKDKTSIFISHRLSSTKFCDRILFMENGRITEEGNHELLMERQGAYAEMFHTQAQYYEKEEAQP